MKNRWIISTIILLICSHAWAKTLDIVVVGLFKNQAVVEINKKQRLLKIGKKSPEGITLISATSRLAVLDINGEQKIYQLGSHIGTNYTAPNQQPIVSLWPEGNQYLTAGNINGFAVEFLVDTGATSIALSKREAKRLGINYLAGQKIGIRTASDIVQGYSVILDTVRVGDITLHNIEAMISSGISSHKILLGMSFLGKLDIHQVGDRMDLQKRF